MRTRLIAASLAAIQWLGLFDTAACAHAQAAAPFPEVVIEPAAPHSHFVANLVVVAGAGLIGSSFLWRDRANHSYGEYLNETDPSRIQSLYDRTERQDRLSSASLITGEVVLAAGVYLRFLRASSTPRLGLSIQPERCAVSYRF